MDLKIFFWSVMAISMHVKAEKGTNQHFARMIIVKIVKHVPPVTDYYQVSKFKIKMSFSYTES